MSGGQIVSAYSGSFAQGYASTGQTIEASASNSAQFGPGTNAQANSLQVGNAGMRFMGTTSAPGTPQPGDLFVDASSVLNVGTGAIRLGTLPTSDPANVGQLWSNLGIVTVSAG